MQLKVINNIIKFTGENYSRTLESSCEAKYSKFFFFTVFPYKNIYIYILHNIRKASIIYALRLYRE